MAWQEVKEFGKVEKQSPIERDEEESTEESTEEQPQDALDPRQIRAEIGRASRGIHDELSDNVLSMANQARTNPAQQKAILGTVRRMIREANIPEFKE